MEKQKELKQVVAFGQPALVRIPIDEIGEIVSGRTYWQQKVQKVAYSHLDVFVRTTHQNNGRLFMLTLLNFFS